MIKHCDVNSKIIHNVADGRKNKNMIEKIEKNEKEYGIIVKDDHQIKEKYLIFTRKVL